MKTIPLNTPVFVTAKPSDDFHDFCGTVIDHLIETNVYIVQDQEDDVFQVDADQVEIDK